MAGEPNYLDVKIMGREYRLACSPDERQSLMAAVELVDAKMREIAQKTRTTIAERVAVMAALNIAHEHLNAPPVVLDVPNENIDTSEAKRRILHMGALIDSVLEPQQELDL